MDTFRDISKRFHINAYFVLAFIFSKIGSIEGGNAACLPFCNIPSIWINQAKHICHGTKDDDYVTFRINRDCQLYAIRLRHVSGQVKCRVGDDNLSRWGCNVNDRHCKDVIPGKCLGTVILDPKTGSLFAPEITLEIGWYSLPGFKLDDDVLFFRKEANLTKGDEFELWYGEDKYYPQEEYDNAGRHCVDVDISCYV